MPPRPAVVRLYFDADVLGLAKVVANLRPEITYPGDPGAVVRKRVRPPCPITRTDTPDPEWIAQVAQAGWLIVTRDSMIQNRRAELDAVRTSGARMVALAGRDAIGTWNQLEVLMVNWRRIEAFADRPGPFIYTVTRTAPPRSISLI